MQVIDIINHGRNNELILTQKDIPSPGDDEILIDIKASGVNRPDILQRFGLHPPPKGSPSYPGLEVSGIVIEIGCNVKNFKLGDKVMALLGGGGYAEFCVANQNLTIPMPENISFTEAAAIPETYFTVWNNVFRIGKLKENEKILIHGGSSGIGTTAIQMSKEFGATVITTTSDKNKEDKCYKIGADMVINYNKDDFVDIIEKSNFRNVDIILDIVGGDYTNRNFLIASMFARIIQIAYIKGNNVEIDLSQIMRKSLTHSGSVLRPKDLSYKSSIANDIKKNIMPIIESGKLFPVIFKTFKLEDAYLAHELMKSGKHFGKIVLV